MKLICQCYSLHDHAHNIVSLFVTTADLPPGIVEFLVSPNYNIYLTPNSQSCFSVRVFDGEDQRQDLQVSVYGSINQFANITEIGLDVIFCYTFTSVLPVLMDFTSLTFVIEDSASNVVTYTPVINVCPCSTNGKCLQPSDSEFQPRIGNVLIQDCVCNSLPGEYLQVRLPIYPFVQNISGMFHVYRESE